MNIEDIYDINGVYNLFKSYNGVGNENCIFYATMEREITIKDIALSALIVGSLNAIDAKVVGISKNGQAYPGYLINVTEYGIGLIALDNVEFTTQYSINKMKVVDNSYTFISNQDIKTLNSRRDRVCLDKNIRFVTIETYSGLKLYFRVKITNKYLNYQEHNFKKFMERYETKANNKTLYLVIGLLLLAVILVIIGITADSSDNDDSKIHKVPVVTGK